MNFIYFDLIEVDKKPLEESKVRQTLINVNRKFKSITYTTQIHFIHCLIFQVNIHQSKNFHSLM